MSSLSDHGQASGEAARDRAGVSSQHFHGTGPRAMALRKHRAELLAMIREAGGSNLRVFGSVATGTDVDGSDIDLVFTIDSGVGLFAIVRLERQVADLVGYEVDLVPDTDMLPVIRDRALAEAVPL
jgi:predicted nucleotidyltransferase